MTYSTVVIESPLGSHMKSNGSTRSAIASSKDDDLLRRALGEDARVQRVGVARTCVEVS
jgi:hypothetical protein